MVERQLRARGIRDEAVLAAMASVQRELFVPAEFAARAYDDEALPIADGQTISQPYMVAIMVELLRPRPGMRVLEIGTGSGYGAAILAAAGCDVLSIERYEGLAAAAVGRLAGIGRGSRVRIVVGDGSVGVAGEAPFDGIVVTAAAPAVPAALRAQLAEGGRLVVPVGPRHGQELILVTRTGDDFHERSCGPCIFVPLVGAGGFSDETPGGRSWRGRLGLLA
jgi:protein-L-isoaspartate(D-aspartate) O-methyltransferase